MRRSICGLQRSSARSLSRQKVRQHVPRIQGYPERGRGEERSPYTKIDQEGEWRRIKRKIYSPFWRGIHNLVAHPMLTIYRPLGERLHEYTARKMYEPRLGVDPDVTDSD